MNVPIFHFIYLCSACLSNTVCNLTPVEDFYLFSFGEYQLSLDSNLIEEKSLKITVTQKVNKMINLIKFMYGVDIKLRAPLTSKKLMNRVHLK